MNAIGAPVPVVLQEDATKTRADQQKVGVSTRLEAAAITSFDSVVPGILAGNKKAVDSEKSSVYDVLIGAIPPTYERYEPTSHWTGIGSHLTKTKGAKQVQLRLTVLLDQTTDENEVTCLAQGLTGDLVSLLSQMDAWLTKSYCKITTDTVYSGKVAWCMLMECLAKILEELYSAREDVPDAARLAPELSIWGMLRAWKVQQRLLQNNFQDDPMLTGVFVQGILLHGEDVSLKDHLHEIEEVTDCIGDRFWTLTNELKSLCNDLKKHQKDGH